MIFTTDLGLDCIPTPAPALEQKSALGLPDSLPPKPIKEKEGRSLGSRLDMTVLHGT